MRDSPTLARGGDPGEGSEAVSEQEARELDTAVARAMGLEVVPDDLNWRGVQIGCAGIYGRDLPCYSTSIAAAWEIVARFDAIEVIRDADAPRPWKCRIWTGKAWVKRLAETAPEAICRAAILAVKETP